MARNGVQLEKGLSHSAFLERYGTEEQCHAALVAWRWPEGFVCPRCGGRDHSFCAPRRLFQCFACQCQTSVRAGTVFQASKLPLRTWFLAMYLLAQSKNDIAALELMRLLGVKYDTAWLLKQKLFGAMQAHNAERPLPGLIQVDDAYLGGGAIRQPGDRSGRGAPNKLPFLAAVATRDGKPSAIHLRPVTGFTKAAIGGYAARNLAAGSAVVSDGLRCFNGFAGAGLTHVSIRTGSGKRPGEPALAWVNSVLGNIKAALTGTCRAVRHHHAGRYRAGFEWRFNHRLNLAEILPRRATTALRQHPTPLRSFRTAEADG